MAMLLSDWTFSLASLALLLLLAENVLGATGVTLFARDGMDRGG